MTEQEQLFEKWMPYAEARAKQTLPQHLLEDGMQEAMIGLWDAVNKYNPDSGYQFNTFATTCIRNRIYNFIRKEKRQTENIDYVDFIDDAAKDQGLSAQDSVEHDAKRQAIIIACGEMTKREGFVLYNRMLSEDPATLQMIADFFDTTKMSVMRDEQRLQDRIKNNMTKGER